ncbi:YjjG family noncanonical pyrimidine nucleotidase [Oscillibacter sp.]|uniref:YjjG family noncanonical pyrimidine nucleotidase n=1 Tax=Oscillibacter sp. TaxID=1945593 RepID=UPI00261A4139|nr:YjjG family noncanonical pyrimidine nucleotidase [Oscillibacter sp.]MDD3347721.1 YjjG family noncanonical pyrimidine nucleotidase [Oscillibacter sp.]
MKYPYLLFDADDTLFDFPKASARAFSTMCQTHRIPNTPETRQLYHAINLELWAAFDRGEVDKAYVTLERYVRFLSALHLDRDPFQCNRDYLTSLGSTVYPLPYAEEVCQTLHARGHRMYLITNAVASVQRSRLAGSVFAELFLDAFISEEAGAAKPDPAYYRYVRARVPAITAENTLVIGDSLSTDIRGANNAHLPCCWFNPDKNPRPADLEINYEITDLRQLLQIV